MSSQVQVLFVCLGNICRSPTAHGVFERYVEDAGLSALIAVDSAGTASWHQGKAPDSRSSATALTRGFDLSSQRSRPVEPNDFERFDYILAMDADNLSNLQAMQPAHFKGQLSLFLEYLSGDDALNHYREVPDPYYEGQDGFELVLDLVESASQSLLDHIREKHLSGS